MSGPDTNRHGALGVTIMLAPSVALYGGVAIAIIAWVLR